jgi:protein TonB
MAKTADKKHTTLAELRFKPANSNDAERAQFSHHFVNVPRCSFAKDDGISTYLGSETGMDTFPQPPTEQEPLHKDVPAIECEVPAAAGGLARKLLRSGFALSVFLHAVAVIAVGYLVLPDDTSLVEGVTSVTLVVRGVETDLRLEGEKTEKQEDEPEPEIETKPVEKEPVKPMEKLLEKKPAPVERPKVVQPVEAKTEDILKDVPMPELGADLPEILTTQTPSEVKAETTAKTVPVEKKIEPKPKELATAALPEKPAEKKPEEKSVEKKPEAKKEEPKKESEKKLEKKKKEEPKKRKNKKGERGKDKERPDLGDSEAINKGKRSSVSSQGASNNRELGNAARSNYQGKVEKKLLRAKSRVRNPGKGSVTVSFVIAANGDISGLRIKKSSGKEAIDAAALKIVNKAAPFLPIPAETGRKSWPMTQIIDFE